MKTVIYLIALSAFISSYAFAETEETRYYRLECEKTQEPQACRTYQYVKESEKKPDNERGRILGLDEPYSVVISKKENLTARLVSTRREYSPEEKKKYINIASKKFKEASELQFSEDGVLYRFDVSGVPDDKAESSVEVLFSSKDYVYLIGKFPNKPDKYDQSKTHFDYFLLDRKFKTLIELFNFRGNPPSQGDTSNPILTKKGSDYTFKWRGMLDGSKKNIYYTFSVLPNEKLDCKKSWDDCEGINIVPRKQ